MRFMKIDLNIFKGSCRQNEIEQTPRKHPAIATDEILSFKQISKAIKNLEIEKINKCIILG